MADDRTKRQPQDSARVNVLEDHEVEYWTHKWAASRAQLEAAVAKAGVSAKAVAAELGK